jgi:hypothetical protein
MANGDCPVGARNTANIENLCRDMSSVRGRLDHVDERLAEVETQQRLQTSRLSWSSTVLVAIIAALAAIAGPLLAQYISH